ncbi:hypothetical protein CC78DRAFT_604142 [Lojkania enalia]|uniref:Uncharacterized protein n=1 Tax=Lojkania enalia TaxID=147567 RepID=A0A9P4NA53_9PLEO|nr:hypothetical protein CC78DRAFT_604142 [Didymosphaeria enalia]
MNRRFDPMFYWKNLPRAKIPLITSQDVEMSHNQRLIPDTSREAERTTHHVKARISWLSWTSALLTIGFLILTSVYASEAKMTSRVQFLYNSSSNTIFVLSILSILTGFFLAATIATTFEKVLWSLISRPEGLQLSKYLSLQAGTGTMGLLTLLIGRGMGMRGSTRWWAGLRLGAIMLVPILNILIMSWGMSIFNASLAKNVSSIANQVSQADLANFLSSRYRTVDITSTPDRVIPCNHIPGQSNTRNCKRIYYMPGGLELAATQEVKDNAMSEIILAENQQGYILDFTEGPGPGEVWNFDAETECGVYGFPVGAFHLCLKNGAPNTLQARIVHCPLSVSSRSECIQNKTWPSAPGWTTSLTTLFRDGTVAYSITNGTILSHIFTSEPIDAPVSATEMLAGYRYAFSSFESVTDILEAFRKPEETNMFSLYIYPAMVWANLRAISDLSSQNPASATRAQDTLQCLLGIMLYYCQPSLFSSQLSIYLNETSSSSGPQTGTTDVENLKMLAQELRRKAPPDTNVRQAVRRYQLLVGKNILRAYIILSGTALLACLITLGWAEWWASRKNIPVPSVGPFPAWDDWVKCNIRRGDETENHEENIRMTLRSNEGGIVKIAERMKISLANDGDERV